jgi:hypothetical protein
MRRNHLKLQLLFVASMALASPFAAADVIDDAYRLCKAMDDTGLATQCEVEGWGSTVDVTIDTNGAEARKICAGVVKVMAKQTRTFAGKWKLRIFSPYSGQRPIAVCTLR